MKIIKMYTGPICNFCDAAKRLLARNNLKYQEIDISSAANLREEMIKDEITINGNPIKATYNGPFTLPPFRRNEAMFSVYWKN